MSKTIEMIKKYNAFNEQEQRDKEFIINCEEKLGDILTRNNEICHLCSSAFVVNLDKTKVLCVYHNIYQSWIFPGGHADGDDDMLYVAQKEVREETSLKNFKPIFEYPISIETIGVQSHYKKGKFIPSHIHLNVSYLFEAREEDTIQILEDENSNIGWLTWEEVCEKSTEPHIIKVFKKVKEKIDLMKQKGTI